MKRRVLVLNQDYTPFTISSVARAFLLVYLKKAEMINAVEDSALRTVTTFYPMPSVIRLSRYVHMPYRGVMLTRQNIFKRDGYLCQYCGTSKDLTIDHIIPRSKSGRSTWKNLVTACKRCNSKKGDFSLEESGMLLKSKPYKPSYILFLRDFSGFAEKNWQPYLEK